MTVEDYLYSVVDSSKVVKESLLVLGRDNNLVIFVVGYKDTVERQGWSAECTSRWFNPSDGVNVDIRK